MAGGLTYAAYNVVGAVLILPTLRHLRSRRDATVAGLVCGPLAMAPALVFFVCLCAFGLQVSHEALPSDFLLRRLHAPAFHVLFQLMIFSALLESSAGSVHALNQRIVAWRTGRGLASGPRLRAGATALLLVFAMGVSQAIGLIDLIAKGYRMLAYVAILAFIVPLFTVGLWTVLRRTQEASPAGSPA